MLRDTNETSETKIIAKQTAASSFINELLFKNTPALIQ